MTEKYQNQPERTIESLGLDPSNPNDQLIIEGAHGDYTLALWTLAKEDLMSRRTIDMYSATEYGSARHAKLVDDVNERIRTRESELGFGEDSPEQP